MICPRFGRVQSLQLLSLLRFLRLPGGTGNFGGAGDSVAVDVGSPSDQVIQIVPLPKENPYNYEVEPVGTQRSKGESSD